MYCTSLNRSRSPTFSWTDLCSELFEGANYLKVITSLRHSGACTLNFQLHCPRKRLYPFAWTMHAPCLLSWDGHCTHPILIPALPILPYEVLRQKHTRGEGKDREWWKKDIHVHKNCQKKQVNNRQFNTSLWFLVSQVWACPSWFFLIIHIPCSSMYFPTLSFHTLYYKIQ